MTVSGPMSQDAISCRRALREIGEIAAVAVLDDSQMTDQEALQTISAIARWVDEDFPNEHADCGDVIRRLQAMTAGVDFETMDDPHALALFSEVLEALQTRT